MFLVLVVHATVPSDAHAQDLGFAPYRWQHAVATGISGVGAAAAWSIGPPLRANWTSTNDFDLGARDALRFDTEDGRRTAAMTTDALLAVLATSALVIDTLVTGFGRDDWERALHLGAISLEAMSYGFLLHGILSRVVGRQRPLVLACTGSVALGECGGHDQLNTAFPSGHTTMAFSAAGAMCSTHLNAAVYGDLAADATACGTALALATSVALLRVAADRHWLTDVMMGATVGTLAGWLTPTLIHFTRWEGPEGSQMAILPAAAGAELGVSWMLVH